MKKTSASLLPLLAVLALLPLAGCSSNFTLPWEQNQLDPSRIATREPLEIPPDLHILPGQEPPEEQSGGRMARSREDGTPSSARSILFKTPESKQESKPLGRDEQERLPGWLGSSRNGR
ncbi:MAG: hypothetical protein G8237_08030 [Magnetococcales bacterium]|nr:hypothetical protein [Magnetococcales bacterium]